MNAAELTPALARKLIREDSYFVTTSGVSLGYAQANIVMLPKQYAADFHRFCALNSKACPVIYISEAGEYSADNLGEDIDIRTDLPGYHVFENGELTSRTTHIKELWQEDLVVFYIGCSFSFEEALLTHGVHIPHITAGHNVAMYRSNKPLISSGPFSGNMVVSLRSLSPCDAIKAIQITSEMPQVHGAPVHLGDPRQIGIDDISQPDFGDVPQLNAGEMLTFWACGVSAQVALANAQLPFAITHAPGQMLITDIPNWKLRYA